MKKMILNSKKIGLLLIGAMLISSFVRAIGTYTAVASGNWSSSVTWGGTPPPFKLTAGDQVNIATGITVTMDSTVIVNGLLSQISVAGTLTSANSSYLYVTSGTLTGAGVVDVGNVVLGVGSAFSFTGTLAAQTLSSAVASLSSTANVMVNDTLTLMGILNVNTGGVLGVGNSSTIVISGGQLSLTGGTLNLSTSYNVNYTTTWATTGMELSGSGLKNVTINVGAANSVALSGSFTSSDSLKFMTGSLVLNGNSLTINGAVTGSANFVGDAAADLTINTSGGIKPSLVFATGGQILNNLTVNIGSGNSAMLASNLDVTGTLALSGGSNLNIGGVALTLDGALSGTGMLAVNSTSSLVIDTAGSVSTPIALSGTSIGNFTVNVGSGNTVTMGSNLSVAGTLSLKSGILILNSHDLSVMGDIAASGSGVLFSTSSSNITINTATSTSGNLTFSNLGSTINNFNVNIGGAGSVMLGSDLTVQGALTFTAGLVNTGSYNLQIASSGSISGANNNSYVITATNGELTMNATTSGVTSFPVGTTKYYFPASITLNSGSSTGTIGVNVSSGVYAQGTSGTQISATQPMVDATWLFQTNITSGLNYNMGLAWSPSAEVNGFVHTSDYIAHYTSGNWDANAYATAAASGSGMFSIARSGLTSMSPFAVFDSSTAPASINEVANTNSFVVYPNPATENIYVKNNWAGTGAVNIQIVNICGQVISTLEMNNTSVTSIPLKGLNSGVYFLRFYNDNVNVVQKFIKSE